MLIGLLTGGCAKGLLIYQVSSLDMLTAVLLPKPSIMRARTGNYLISGPFDGNSIIGTTITISRDGSFFMPSDPFNFRM